MGTVKINNRKLRGGKNKTNFKNQITNEKMIDNFMGWLDDNRATLLDAAQQYYDLCGYRGCLNFSLTENPSIPFKTNKFTYVTIDAYEEMQADGYVKRVYDDFISKHISTYDPTSQGVVCIWFGTIHIVTVLTGYLNLGEVQSQKSLVSH